MKPIKISALDSEQLDALEDLYRTTRDARLRTRAQMTLLAARGGPPPYVPIILCGRLSGPGRIPL